MRFLGHCKEERYKKEFSEQGVAMGEVAKDQAHGVGRKTLGKSKLIKIN